MKPDEKDREAAFRAIGELIPPCWHEKASERLAVYAAIVRAEGYRAGLEAAGDAAHNAIHEAVDEMVECERIKSVVAAAIRALAGRDG